MLNAHTWLRGGGWKHACELNCNAEKCILKNLSKITQGWTNAESSQKTIKMVIPPKLSFNSVTILQYNISPYNLKDLINITFVMLIMLPTLAYKVQIVVIYLFIVNLVISFSSSPTVLCCFNSLHQKFLAKCS